MGLVVHTVGQRRLDLRRIQELLERDGPFDARGQLPGADAALAGPVSNPMSNAVADTRNTVLPMMVLLPPVHL